MRLPSFHYLEPKSVEEAALLLKEHGTEGKVIAGGTDLLPSMKQGILKPKYLIGLNGVKGLDAISFDPKKGLLLGSMVRLCSLEKDPLVSEMYPAIREAAKAVGSPQLRQMGTLGGNLSLDTRCYYYNQSDSWRRSRPTCIKMGGDRCNAVGGGKKCFAVFSGDLAPALTALDAKIRLFSHKGERMVSLMDYYSGKGESPLTRNPQEVLVSIEIPPPREGAFTAYYKYRIRRSIDFPLAAVAVVIRTGAMHKECLGAKVVMGAVGTRPQEVLEIGSFLEGKGLGPAVIEEASQLAFKEAKPVHNLASSPAYRKFMIKVLTQDALEKAAGACQG